MHVRGEINTQKERTNLLESHQLGLLQTSWEVLGGGFGEVE